METIDFDEAIKQRIGVVEELLKPVCEKMYATIIDETERGIYIVGKDLAPLVPTKKPGCLVVFSQSQFRGIQLFMPDSSLGAIYTRCFMNTVFTTWKSISLADI